MVEIRSDDVTTTVYATDNSIYQLPPSAVALPTSADEIAELLADNHRAASPQPIVARGGGTGTNGQSLTTGLVIDLKRRLNRIVSIDPDRLEAVVEPGVVTAALNAELAGHGLFWAPHTSTLNRATVGGMISTDAAGKGSLVHGRTHRHVRSLDVTLADGTPWTAEPITVAEAERRAEGEATGARLWRALLDLPIGENAAFDLPELARGFSGYGIDRFRRDGMIDPLALLCGAEGTLAVITRATIGLTRLPSNTALLVASYESFGRALEDAVELRDTGPSAIESFDETTLERGRSSPAWPALGAVVGDHHGAVLLLEYSGEEAIDIAAAEVAVAATGRSRAVKALTGAAEQAAAWKVRADAVGLLAKVATGGPQRSARPTAFVEDCAVPVESMSEFIAGFRTILDRAGVSYGMFGHADVGCVHVRPALDLTDPEHEQLIRSITDAVVELVADHGGVLWGEHGRGFRGDSVASFLTPETVEVMRLVKRAFDPDDLLNPGKLYRPAGSDRPILAVDEPPLRGQRDRLVPVAIRHRYDSAFACNGNGLCHHHASTEVMCPSYKATGDPALSPKARTDLLRAWLSRRAEPTGPDEKARADLEAFEDAIAANLHQCLSCSACTGHCPVEVDIPELKSKFLNSYYEHRRRPAAHHLLGRFERVAVTGSKLAGWAPRLTALGARPAGRLLGLVDLPVPKPPSTPGSPPPRFEPGLSQVDLVIMPEVFTTALEPDTLRRAVELLQSMDLSVAVARLVPSGKFDHVKGRRRAFEKSVRAQERLVRSIVDSGAQPVVIEPAVALLHRAEYVHTVAGYPGDAVRHLVEILDRHRDRIARSPAPAAITLLAHCTEQATAPESVAAWKRVLEAAGHTVTVPGVGCCGMAGIFGHEVENQSMSRALWDLTWATRIDAEDAVPVATGYSCRSQAARFADRPVGHPLEHLID